LSLKKQFRLYFFVILLVVSLK